MKAIDPDDLPLGRFFSRVEDVASGCLEWQGGMNNKGYGMIGVQGQRVLAHRLAWVIAHGTDPGELCVLHRCDNPRCVRPEHLFLGTHKDNVRDCVEKGRHVPGRRRRWQR